MKSKQISDIRVVTTSLLVSVGDVGINFIVGLVTGSSVMFSQALQGLSDLVTAAVVFVGVRRSQREPDSKHPFGYGREVFFWVLVAGIFMFLGTGMVSLLLGYKQFVRTEVVNNVFIALGVLLFGLASNSYAFRQSWLRINQNSGREHFWPTLMNSSLVETKATLLVDFMGTVAAGLGLVALTVYALTQNAFYDGLGAAAVGLSMMLASLVLIRDVKSLIVGKAVSASTIEQIKSSAVKVNGVLEVLDLRTMYLGSSKLLILIEVHLKDNLTTDEIELIMDQIKQRIRDETPNVYRVQVEVETP